MARSIGDALRAMPVAVNCYYGDPTLQWQDTVAKLRGLAATGHVGPVAVITKGAIGPNRAKELAGIGLPGLVVMISISELPKGFELVGHNHRYETLRNLRQAGVRSFAAVRPLTPPYNTTEEVLTRIFQRLQAAGCETACVSGFRGDESLVEAMRPSDQVQWVLRVKQMTGFESVLRIAGENGVRLFTRVSCAVSHLMGAAGTYNPYWGSPQLVRCGEIGCPMRETCGPVEPGQQELDWLRRVGYDLEFQTYPRQVCGFSTENRLNCRSCCTTCFVQRQPRVLVRNAETLGDLAFCRFVLGGTLCVKPGMVDGGEEDVGEVKILSNRVGRTLHTINTWWVWSRSLEKCFGCKYCVSSLYPKISVGCAPAELEALVG
jgi:hypothetical protein